MTDKEIQQTWSKLIIPFIIGIIVLITAILFHRIGSKRPGPQTAWLLAGLLGFFLIITPGIKIIKFRRYLRNRKDND